MAEIARAPSQARGLFLLGVVFVLGMICGAALFFTGQRSMAFMHRPGHHPGHPMERMSRELSLDDEQYRAIREILDAQRERLDRVLEESRQAIRAVLRDDQRQRFDDMRPPRPRGPGGPPGPHGPPPPPPPPFGPPPPTGP